MKTTLICLAIACFVFTPLAAQDHGFGIGIVLGEPTGISGKLWTSQANAVQFGLGWTTVGGKYPYGNRADITVDYLWHNFELIRSPHRLPFYYGVGAALTSGGGGTSGMGVRGVVGVGWLSRKIPIDVFLEVVPVMQLVPATSFGIEAGLGARFYIG